MNFTSLHAETDPTRRAAIMNSIMPKGLDTKMEIEFLSISAELCTGRMPVAGNNQAFGILHGGANAVLAESLASIAAFMLINEGQRAVGLQVQMTHHGAATSGLLLGEAKIVHSGKSIATYNVEITDENEKLTSSGQVICFLKR
jgi:1,4-dihydroxy-2-naphthoyl-CoA hydrolase